MSPTDRLEDAFKDVMEKLAGTLKDRGYRKKGNRFTRRCDRGWVVVEVQRSQFNDADQLRFAVNLAATADALRADADPEKPPKAHECPFTRRLSTGDDGSFWSLTSRTNGERLAKRVHRALEKEGIPLLEEVCGAQALRDYWLERVDADGTPLNYLADLLKAIGPEERVSEVESRLEAVMARNRASAEAAADSADASS